ncbi:uncharacterized protein [Oryza sativa Japonica Group]|uniref:Uncharacterized protein n=3 Tax=Oryza TaxID=4527 RepID=Q7EYE6_ORYSJ|nr:hypothetical protein DAI22_08g040300 [Oryza sativa Japonica Group]BAC99569.1 hypothetical protein [Oryza sativa Japonica Group]BAC99784.1 hypothetical protein [Oryza sativa Japonica Group]
MASAISRAAARLPLLRLSSQALLPTQIARFRSEFVQPNKPTADGIKLAQAVCDTEMNLASILLVQKSLDEKLAQHKLLSNVSLFEDKEVSQRSEEHSKQLTVQDIQMKKDELLSDIRRVEILEGTLRSLQKTRFQSQDNNICAQRLKGSEDGFTLCYSPLDFVSSAGFFYVYYYYYM